MTIFRDILEDVRPRAMLPHFRQSGQVYAGFEAELMWNPQAVAEEMKVAAQSKRRGSGFYSELKKLWVGDESALPRVWPRLYLASLVSGVIGGKTLVLSRSKQLRTKDSNLNYLEPDSSVGSSSGAGYLDVADDVIGAVGGKFAQENGLEVVSRKMPALDAAAAIGRMLNWVEDSRYLWTNDSCGFHVTISGFRPDAVGLVRLVWSLDAEEWASAFNRSSNTYAKTFERLMPLSAGHDVAVEVKYGVPPPEWALRPSPELTSSFELYMETRLATEYAAKSAPAIKTRSHHMAVDLQKIAELGLLEFRAIGGEGYERRADEVAHAVGHAAAAVEFATGSSRPREYEEFLMRWMAETSGAFKAWSGRA